jgi:hypothetical protein
MLTSAAQHTTMAADTSARVSNIVLILMTGPLFIPGLTVSILTKKHTKNIRLQPSTAGCTLDETQKSLRRTSMATTRAFRLSVRVVTLAFVSCFFGAAQSPLLQKFVGVWVEDETKLKIGDSMGNLRFRQTAGGGLEELRGYDAKPLVEPVKFGVKPYAIDGSKNTIVWKQVDARHYERKIFHEDKLQNTRKIEISDDGRTLTEVRESVLANGKTSLTTVTFRRASRGPQGLAGIWKAVAFKRNSSPTVHYELTAAGELKVSDDIGGNEREFTVKMNNTPVPVMGPSVISGTMIAFRVADDHTLESTFSTGGVVTAKEMRTLSNDGKVITSTTTLIGPKGNKSPTVRIYNKQ